MSTLMTISGIYLFLRLVFYAIVKKISQTRYDLYDCDQYYGGVTCPELRKVHDHPQAVARPSHIMPEKSPHTCHKATTLVGGKINETKT